MLVTMKDADRISLVGFFLQDLLKTNLVSKSHQSMAARIDASILFLVSGMEVTVHFKREAVEIFPGRYGVVAATVTGDLSTMLDVALGASYLKPLLKRKIRIQGNMVKLLQVIKVLRREPS